MHAPGTEKVLSGHKIQTMTQEDLNEVLAIEEVSFPNPWKRSMFTSELSNPVSYSYTIKSSYKGKKKVTAYIVFWVVHGEAHILDLAVHPDFRGIGLGEMLLRYALDKMCDSLVFEVFLEVRKSNRAAICLYKKLGFKEGFERKKYYGDEDAIVMTKSIH